MTPSTLVDIRPDHLGIVQDIVRTHLPPEVRVWVFGSRADWTTKDSSDLDLALEGDGPVDDQRVTEMKLAFEESELPYTVDLVDIHRVGDGFRRRVMNQRVALPIGNERNFVPRPSSHEVYFNRNWKTLPFTEAVMVNPQVPIKRGQVSPFVDMASVNGSARYIHAKRQRRFSGSGSRFQDGDTLMARITPCLENGKIAQFRTTDPSVSAHGSTEFIVVRGLRGVTDTNFAYYLTRSEQVRSYAISQMTGTSGRQRVPVGSLAHLEVKIPSIPEQLAIARILGALDDKIELSWRMNETLEAMARSIFKDWFVDFGPTRAKVEGRDPYLDSEVWKLFPDTLDSDGKPKGWQISNIGKEVEVMGGATPSTKEPGYWDYGVRNWATPKDLSKLSSPVLLGTDRKITDVGVEQISSGILPSGAVLLSSRAPIGYLAISTIPTAVNQGFIAMVCERRLPNVFVLFWCHENLDYIKGISGGSTFAEISKRTFRTVPVIVPNETVLAAYRCLVRPLFGHIVANAKESASLTQIREALLPKLISGEIHVQ